ncbi:MAG: DKNYY domain-containing protein [Patescibacteria group bacterium]
MLDSDLAHPATNPQIPSDLDQKTFTFLPRTYYQTGQDLSKIFDKNTILTPITLTTGESVLLLPYSFSVYPYYAKDKNHVYAGGKILLKADPVTFTLSESFFPYTKDKNYVWIAGHMIDKADAPTFVILNLFYTKDKNQVYFYDHYGSQNTSIIDADSSTFQLIAEDNSFAKDAKHVFGPDGKIITGADISTFVIIDKHFEKSKNNVFFQGKIIPGADATTFATINGTSYFKDTYHLYSSTNYGEAPKVVSIPLYIDAATLEFIGGDCDSSYFKDKNNRVYQISFYYFEGGIKLVAGADSRSFKIYSGSCKFEP